MEDGDVQEEQLVLGPGLGLTVTSLVSTEDGRAGGKDSFDQLG